ncbi:hypothetical protein PROFUN_09659 [Planoprotostelium fungivorum]|uniref:Uncharacterized protein n=1 Tax=Planoprotostelium fungivorum TaxID=1890364 RepID=A0A2P6NGI1_9EUKA|nr:hypothetical protein PROFUN_09659 [Planoprotostelium fungivorum]
MTTIENVKRENERIKIEAEWRNTMPLIKYGQEIILWEHPSTFRIYVRTLLPPTLLLLLTWIYGSHFSTLTWWSMIAMVFVAFGPIIRWASTTTFRRMEVRAAEGATGNPETELWRFIVRVNLAYRCDLQTNVDSLLHFRRSNSTKFTLHCGFVLILLFVLSNQFDLLSTLVALLYAALLGPGFFYQQVPRKTWHKVSSSPIYQNKIAPHIETVAVLLGIHAPPEAPTPAPSAAPSLNNSTVSAGETLGSVNVTVSAGDPTTGLSTTTKITATTAPTHNIATAAAAARV